MKTRRSKRIVYCVFILSWFLMMPGSELASAEGKTAKDLGSVDKSQLQEIEHELRKEAKNLSLLERDLHLIYASMTSFQAKDRSELIRCQLDVARARAIYTYVADRLEQLLLVKEDRISYYAYLEKEGIEEMKTSVNQYLVNIERARAQITDKSALSLLDKTTETVDSSLALLDRVIEVLKQDRKPEERGDAVSPQIIM